MEKVSKILTEVVEAGDRNYELNGSEDMISAIVELHICIAAIFLKYIYLSLLCPVKTEKSWRFGCQRSPAKKTHDKYLVKISPKPRDSYAV